MTKPKPELKIPKESRAKPALPPIKIPRGMDYKRYMAVMATPGD